MAYPGDSDGDVFPEGEAWGVRDWETQILRGLGEATEVPWGGEATYWLVGYYGALLVIELSSYRTAIG